MSKANLLAVALSITVVLAMWPHVVRSHDADATTSVTFDREIVQILNRRCVWCHSGSGVSFPLTTYRETWLRAIPIKTSILRRHMPPWSAVPGYGQFVNDNGLTRSEIEFLVSWLNGGAPINAAVAAGEVPGVDAATAVKAEAHAGHWMLGHPDLTRPLTPVPIPRGSGNGITRSVIDLELTNERWLRGLEYLPSNPRAIRAVFFTLKETGQWLGSWTPWYGFYSLPQGAAHHLATGSQIHAEIHYRASEAATVEQGTLGLLFADAPPTLVPSDVVLETVLREGPAAPLRKLTARLQLPADTYLMALLPENTEGVASLEVDVRAPNGRSDVVLMAVNVDKGWPTPYILKRPMFLSKGTQLSVVAYSKLNDSALLKVRVSTSATR